MLSLDIKFNKIIVYVVCLTLDWCSRMHPEKWTQESSHSSRFRKKPKENMVCGFV